MSNEPHKLSCALNKGGDRCNCPGTELGLPSRLVAHPKWPHGQPSGGGRGAEGILWHYSDQEDWDRGGAGHQVPDLHDDATAGVLLAMLPADKGAWHQPLSRRWLVQVEWESESTRTVSQFQSTSLGIACARALLAVWGAIDGRTWDEVPRG